GCAMPTIAASSGTDASNRAPPFKRARRAATRSPSLLGRLLDEAAILLGAHEVVEIAAIGKRDLDHPPVAVGILVEELRVVREVVVHLGDLARDRGVDVGDGLGRFDDAEGVGLL